jgi:hypothetical protein
MSESKQPGNCYERIQVEGEKLLDTVQELIHEGNVRHLVLKHDGNTVLEIPVTLGVIGAVLAPTLAAVAAVGAVLTQCTIDIVRTEDPTETPEPPRD